MSQEARTEAGRLREALSARKREAPPPREEGLIDSSSVARLLNISRRTLARLMSEGAIPEPVRITNKIVRWRVEELREWIECDCPNRKQWEDMRRRTQDGNASSALRPKTRRG